MGRERVAGFSPVRSFADRESDSSLADAITWVGVALQTVWTVAVLWTGSDAGSSVDDFEILVLGSLLLMFIWGWRWVIYLREHVDTRSGKWRLAPLLVIACALFVAFGGAFFVRFLASRPALDRFASSMVAAGPMVPNPPAPIEVGLFQVRDVEVLTHGTVRLIIGKDWFYDAGLVYCAEGEPPVIDEDFYAPLGGGWFHWHRSF